MEDTGRRPLRIGLALLGGVGLAFAYRSLITLGPRFGLESGTEYWLFVPNDRAPLVVLLLAAWLAWRRAPRLKRLPLQMASVPWIALSLSLGALSYGWSIWVGAEDLQVVSLISNLAALLLLRWGVPGLRAMWLPLAFLLFCLPIPSPILVTVLWELRLIAAEYTGWLLYLVGVPALVSGDQILRASQTFQVIEGCSGLRSAETLTMLVVLLVDLFERRGLHAVLLLLSAPFVALALNGIRVLTLVLNPHSEVIAVHSLQGIAILMVGLLVVYGLDGLLARIGLGSGTHAIPPREHKQPTGQSAISTDAVLVTLLGLALMTSGASLLLPRWSAPLLPSSLQRLADEALGSGDYEAIRPEAYFLGRTYFRESLHRRYVEALTTVEVFVGVAKSRDRRTSIASGVTSYPGSGWRLLRNQATRRVKLSPDGPEATSLVFEKGTQRMLVYHWLVGVGDLGSETLRSFLGLETSPFRRPHRQLAVRLGTPVSVQPATMQRAAKRLSDAYERLEPALRAVTWPTLAP